MAQQTSNDQAPVYAACLDSEGARALVTKLYGWSIDDIKQLPGYDDLNFYIKRSNGPSENDEFVLKIVNSRDSSNLDLMRAQTDVLLYLSECGIVCPTPVKNLSGKYCCLEELTDLTGKQPAGLKFMVRMIVFIPGKLVRDLYQPNTPGVPDKWFYTLGRRLATLDTALLNFQNPSAIASLKKQADDFIWSPSCCPMVRKCCWAVKDEEKRKLAEAVLRAFDSEIVPRMAKERKCVIHTDYNDMNIISRIKRDPPDNNTTWHTAGGVDISASQDTRLEVVGLIDFSDIVYTNLVFDVGNSLAYMMMSQTLGDPLVSGGHFLAGYNSVLLLTTTEMSLIRVCACSRLVQSLVNGLHAFTLDPSHEYVLDTQKTGWNVLNQLWRKPNEDLITMWGEIDKLYCLPIDKFSSPNPNCLEIATSPNSPHIIQKPFLKTKTAETLLQKLYGFRTSDIKNIKELLSYADQNFYVRVGGDGETESAQDEEFVLKLINSNDSKQRGAFEMQISVLQFLRAKGFACASPVHNVKGSYLSLEKICKSDEDEESVGDRNGYGLFLTFLLTFVPGQMMSKVDPVPDQLFFNAGVHLAKLDKSLLDFPDIPESFKSHASNLDWSMECLSWIRPYIEEIDDPDRRRLVESLLKAFDKEVVPKIETLRKCIIHNDFNDYNILVMEKTPPSVTENCTLSSPTTAKKMKPCPKYDITGVIDFTDMIYSCLLFEVCTALCFMMYTKTDNPTAATGYFLAGFQSVIPLKEEEMSLLYLCMVARISQDLVLALHNYRLQPGNEYILITQERGWRFLKELWGEPGAKDRVEKLWKTIADTYTD